jgi:hypothetical protein
MELKKIALLHTDDVGNEFEAIRQTLEYFGYEVFRKAIGRPADFVEVINGKNEFLAQIPIWVLSVHGQEGKFVMPELGKDVYQKTEPRSNIGPDFIKQHGRFGRQIVLTTACTLGNDSMASAFLENGASAFIGPADYIEGNAALLFAQHFFYQLTVAPSDVEGAFNKARAIDKETSIFTWHTK